MRHYLARSITFHIKIAIVHPQANELMARAVWMVRKRPFVHLLKSPGFSVFAILAAVVFIVNITVSGALGITTFDFVQGRAVRGAAGVAVSPSDWSFNIQAVSRDPCLHSPGNAAP